MNCELGYSGDTQSGEKGDNIGVSGGINMHLIVTVVEMESGQRIVTLNNNRVYISTDEGILEPAKTTWLGLPPPENSVGRGGVFECGFVKETPLKNCLR